MPIHRLGTLPPLVQVGLSVGGSYLKRGQGVAAVTKNALLDTGATVTAVRPAELAALSPFRLGRIEVLRADGSKDWRNTYDVRLAFEPDPQLPGWWLSGHWFNLEIVAAAPADPGIDVLIGRDLLDKVIFSWDGPKQRLVLSY